MNTQNMPKPAFPTSGAGGVCGQCRHGHAISPDITQALECREQPPHPTALVAPPPPGRPGYQIIVHTAYPRVQRAAPCCGRFAPKATVQ